MSKRIYKNRRKIIACFLIIAATVAAYIFNLYATMSRPVANPSEIHWLQSTPIAHRGLHHNNSEVPENSLAAFEKAIQKGYVIELDVQLNADNEVVVFHDYGLKRMTGVDKKVIECTTEELSKMELMNSGQKIPLLKEVLEFVDGKVPLLIEIKNEGKVGQLEKAVYEELKGYNGKYAVQSFNPYSLKWFRQNAPEVVRGQLSGGFKGENLAWYKKVLLKNLLLNFESKPAFIAYEISELPKDVVNKLSKEGIIVLGWTAKSQEDYDRALKYCHNVIFEGFVPE